MFHFGVEAGVDLFKLGISGPTKPKRTRKESSLLNSTAVSSALSKGVVYLWKPLRAQTVSLS